MTHDIHKLCQVFVAVQQT